ncbi:MAG: type I-U CRISPR-associated protein Cas7 [Myxococcales bacterium]|nr:type I-U CRISPR-associated protein Cas7 [Myxococcales bacterium]
MSDKPVLSLDVLESAVGGRAAAFRAVTRLEPAGGPGDKIFPPTYAVDKAAPLKYAVETRRRNGESIDSVLIDSVASQANRMEEALFAAWEDGRLLFPVIGVDFSGYEDLADLGKITTLQAPHRIADAILRDSVDGHGTPFRSTEAGKAYTDARPQNATAVYRYCPTALVLGVWDSTGPKGGLGAKFQRALVSEIVGYGVVTGSKTASRIDPLGILSGVQVYHISGDDKDYTVDPAQARKNSKGEPELLKAKDKTKKAGRASNTNHSNVAPTIDTTSGGVTIDSAEQTTVLSLVALRQLRFVSAVDGTPLGGSERLVAEKAARTALAALGLAAVVELFAQGFHLRSRSLLVPSRPLEIELVPTTGGQVVTYSLTQDQAAELLNAAHAKAKAVGMEWEREPFSLLPAPKLVDLIRKSRELSRKGVAEDDEVHDAS